LDIAAALETQRLRLLRLLAGLLCVVQFVSLAPVISVLPFRIRLYVSSILDRAEAAADCLVIATASTLFRYRAPVQAGEFLLPLDTESVTTSYASADDLLHRITVLRAILRNLPLHAKRLAQRGKRTSADARAVHPMRDATTGVRFLNFASEAFLSRLELPPERQLRVVRFSISNENSPSISRREAQVFRDQRA